MKIFQGRVVVPGTVTAEALVSHGGFNTLASYQMALQFGDLKAMGKDTEVACVLKPPWLTSASTVTVPGTTTRP